MSEGDQIEGVIAAEQVQSPADLLQKAEAIKQRLLDAQKQREVEIKQKMGDRESLLASLKLVEGDLKKAESILADYNSAIEAATSRDIPPDESAIRGREEIQALVGSLQDQLDQTEKGIGAISSQNEVNSRLRGEANAEESVRNAEKEINLAEEQIGRIVSALVEESKSLNGLWQQDNAELKAFDAEFQKTDKQTGKLVEAVYMDLGINLNSKFVELGSVENLRVFLKQERSKLGLFDGKKKKMFDRVITGANLLEESGALQAEAQRRWSELHSAKWPKLEPTLKKLSEIGGIKKDVFSKIGNIEGTTLGAKSTLIGKFRDVIIKQLDLANEAFDTTGPTREIVQTKIRSIQYGDFLES
ncbi:MAG: hypothetical protein AAB660_02420 [Patescibacteria group bacterium]